MLAKYRLRVYHKNGSGISKFDFPRSSKVVSWEHYHLYESDVMAGYYDRVEYWERRDWIATGEDGEEVWQLILSYPRGR